MADALHHARRAHLTNPAGGCASREHPSVRGYSASRSSSFPQILAVILCLTLFVALAPPSEARAQIVPSGGTAKDSTASAVVAAAKGWMISYGAGQNKPFYNNTWPNVRYTCVGDQPLFKITQASIVMWSNGRDRINGFHFKYRLVPQGTEGELQLPYNWSKNTSTSFKTNKKASRWLIAGALGQSFDSAAAWDLEIKLKYARSRRVDFRTKYRIHIASPQCGVLQ